MQYFKADPILGILLIAVKLGLGAVAGYSIVYMQSQMAAVTSALAARDATTIPRLLYPAIGVFVGMLFSTIVSDWVRYVLHIRMRTNLTQKLLGEWLRDDRYYHLDRKNEVTYPEQRIQEDIYEFTERALLILPSIIGSFLPIFLYSGKLWEISPPLSLESIGIPYVVHGYLVYFTVGFALVWTAVTHLFGSRLTRTEITRLNLEAKFRQEMAVVRENSESVAFQRGADFEGSRLQSTFNLVRENWKRYTVANLRITFTGNIPTILFLMGPVLLCAPFVLEGKMKIGDIQFASAAMGGVYASVGIFISQYRSLALLRAAVSRLRFFNESLEEASSKGELAYSERAVDGFEVSQLKLNLPNGTRLVDVGQLSINRGERVLIRGRSGAGKSTFLRALAGLWKYGHGRIQIPKNAKLYFMPQKVYMPDGTLASLMAYPADPSTVPDTKYLELLDKLNLHALKPRLHEYSSWSRSLSPGEQQRLSAARAVINAPEYLFVDEATSALDVHSEATLYTLLSEQLPTTAVISIAHRPTVERFHDRVIEFSDGKIMEMPLPSSKLTSV